MIDSSRSRATARRGTDSGIAHRDHNSFTGAVRPFDFVGVFYSVVLGVAVTQLMTGVARLVEQRQRVRTYWVHSVWVFTVLLGNTGNWWSLWSLREAPSWHVVTFLLLIALTGTIFLMTVLLFPTMSEPAQDIDLRAHYHANSAIFLRANAAAWALALFCNWTLYPIHTWLDPWISLPATVFILSLAVAQTRRPVVHGTFSIVSLAAILAMLLTQGARIE